MGGEGRGGEGRGRKGKGGEGKGGLTMCVDHAINITHFNIILFAGVFAKPYTACQQILNLVPCVRNV